MLRTLYFTEDGKLHTDLNLMDVAFALTDQKGLLWMDFEASPSEEDEPILLKTFGFHPLAVDDALSESHIPKVDDWGEFVYVVLHAVSFDGVKDGRVETLELDIFLGKNYLVTHHDKPIPAVTSVWNAMQRAERQLRSGTDHLLYRLADEVATSYMPVVEKLDLIIDQTEDDTFAKPTPKTLERIFTLKRATLHLRRIIGPQREVMNKLARDDYTVIDVAEQVYFRDVYDHLVRLYDITESIRDLVTGSMDTYLSVVNNRMNEIMKTLTLITTLFMPLTFVVGFFGMNFFIPDAPISRWVEGRAFLLMWLILLTLPAGMYLWMRRRGWM